MGLKIDGKKIATWTSIENELVGTIRNLWTDEISDEYIESIEPILAIAVPHEMSKLLFEQYETANYVGRKLMEIQYRGAFERAFICRLPTAKKRYDRFIQSYPRLLERVPLKYIASFLEMRVETLSRIRSALSRAKTVLQI